jgi:hypothetical protein
MTELWPGGPIELPHTLLIDDVPVEIGDVPVPRLLHWLATGNWGALYPLNSKSTQPGVNDPLLTRFVDDNDEVVDYEHLYDVATLLFAHLAGVAPTVGMIVTEAASTAAAAGWWPAVRLAATALSSWPAYAGWCATHGTDPLNGPLWRVIPTIYAWVMDTAGGEDPSRLERDIWAPPPPPRGDVAAAAVAVSGRERDHEAAMALAALDQLLPGEQRWDGE